MAISTLLLQCFLSTHIYLFSILSTYSSFFACTEMPLEKAPTQGKQRFKTCRLRLGNQFVFEQMALSIYGGWSKSVDQAILAGRRWGRGQEERTHLAGVNANHSLALYPVARVRCVNLLSLIQKALTCLMWGVAGQKGKWSHQSVKETELNIWHALVSFPSLSQPPLFLLALLRETTILGPHTHTHTDTHQPDVICCRAHTMGGYILLNVTFKMIA